MHTAAFHSGACAALALDLATACSCCYNCEGETGFGLVAVSQACL